MAKLLFNNLARHFGRKAFIEFCHDDTGGNAQKKQSLVDALMNLGCKDVDIHQHHEQLMTKMQQFAAQHKVLVVVDSIWTEQQLDGLLPHSYHPGSRIVITSRSTDMQSATVYQVS
jgi:hypothetical protein